MEYKNIWKKVLRDDEEIEYEFSVGKKYRILGVVTFIILGLLLLTLHPVITVFFIAFGVFYFGFYLKVANAYAFTDKRVLIHTGWLSTHTISVEYEKITDVSVKEPFLERIIAKTGHLSINTAGSSDKEVDLKHIDQPYDVRKKLDRIRK